MKSPDEIKKALEYCQCSYCPRDCPYLDECMLGNPTNVTDLQEYVQQLESQVPRWISVEERLPEKHGGKYLCFCVFDDIPNDEGFTQCLNWWYTFESNGYVERPHFTNEGYQNMRVTHWMPLPSAPEEVI